MYAFTDHILADAVADAAERGVKVRIYRDRTSNMNKRVGEIPYVARQACAEAERLHSA